MGYACEKPHYAAHDIHWDELDGGVKVLIEENGQIDAEELDTVWEVPVVIGDEICVVGYQGNRYMLAIYNDQEAYIHQSGIMNSKGEVELMIERVLDL